MQNTNTPTSLSTYVCTPSVSNTYHPTSITLSNNMDSVELNSMYNFNFLFYKCNDVT